VGGGDVLVEDEQNKDVIARVVAVDIGVAGARYGDPARDPAEHVPTTAESGSTVDQGRDV
jgi:hypothetical protein